MFPPARKCHSHSLMSELCSRFQVGFNAGNGTQAYEYKPYSQNMVIRDLAIRGWANGFPGRHIFRVDEQILIGSCNKDIGMSNRAFALNKCNLNGSMNWETILQAFPV